MPRAPVHPSLVPRPRVPRARRGVTKGNGRAANVQRTTRPTETIKAENVTIDFSKVPVGAPTKVPQACAHRARMYFRHKKSALRSF